MPGSVGLTLDIELDVSSGRLECVSDQGSDLALPLAFVPLLQSDNFEATLVLGIIIFVSQSSGFGKNALTEGVHVSIRSLPKAQNRLRRR